MAPGADTPHNVAAIVPNSPVNTPLRAQGNHRGGGQVTDNRATGWPKGFIGTHVHGDALPAGGTPIGHSIGHGSNVNAGVDARGVGRHPEIAGRRIHEHRVGRGAPHAIRHAGAATVEQSGFVGGRSSRRDVKQIGVIGGDVTDDDAVRYHQDAAEVDSTREGCQVIGNGTVIDATCRTHTFGISPAELPSDIADNQAIAHFRLELTATTGGGVVVDDPRVVGRAVVRASAIAIGGTIAGNDAIAGHVAQGRAVTAAAHRGHIALDQAIVVVRRIGSAAVARGAVSDGAAVDDRLIRASPALGRRVGDD